MNLIIAGIGTEVGKTVVSAVVCHALQADYWKPIQAGDLHNSDSHFVKRMLAGGGNIIHPEAYRLSMPMSPHAAAQIDKTSINLDALMPNFAPGGNKGAKADKARENRHLVIELAGGLMVPLADDLSTIDWVLRLACPVILVANYYLGSINHTLLSLHLLQSRGVELLGIIFNGAPNPASRAIILQQAAVVLLAELPLAPTLDSTFIQTHAKILRQHPAMAGL